MQGVELKKAEVKTFVQCPYCEEPFNLKIEQKTSFLKDCVFCRRTFQVVVEDFLTINAKIPEVAESVCL